MPSVASHAAAACEIITAQKRFQNAACIARVQCTRVTPLFSNVPIVPVCGTRQLQKMRRWLRDGQVRGCVRAWMGGCVLLLILCGSTGTAFYWRLTYILNDAVVRYTSCDWARSSEPSASSSCPRGVRIIRVRTCTSVWANIGHACASGLVVPAEDAELQKEIEEKMSNLCVSVRARARSHALLPPAASIDPLCKAIIDEWPCIDSHFNCSVVLLFFFLAVFVLDVSSSTYWLSNTD